MSRSLIENLKRDPCSFFLNVFFALEETLQDFNLMSRGTNMAFYMFLQQGRRSTEAFLRYYVAKNNPPLKVKHGPITEAKAFNGKVTIMNNHNTKNELMLQNGKTRRSKEIFAYDNKVEPVMEAELNAADIDVQELKTSTFVLNP